MKFVQKTLIIKDSDALRLQAGHSVCGFILDEARRTIPVICLCDADPITDEQLRLRAQAEAVRDSSPRLSTV